MTNDRHLPALLLNLAFHICQVFLVMLLSHPVQAFDAPVFQGDVLDDVGILSESDQQVLRERIRELRESDDIWAAVYIAKGLQQVSIEEAAVETFEKWRIGQKRKDNGVLILIVPNERKMRIEVGYGLEGEITDALSRRIIDEVYAPAFREQRFADGLQQGFDVMAKTKRGEKSLPDLPMEPAQKEINWDGAGSRFLLSLIINILPVAIFITARAHGRRHGRVRKSEGDEDIRTPFIVFLFIGLIFGLFYAIFGAAFADDPEVIKVLALGNGLFIAVFCIPYGLKVRRFLSNTAYRRHLAKTAQPAVNTNPDDNHRGRWTSSSSSSSTDSDTSSSSSDGGSSGGGGSSGEW